MRCSTSSLLTGWRPAINRSQASLRVRPGIIGDSACGPAAVKFLDLEFIYQGDVVDDKHIVAYRQIYEKKAVFVGKANKKISVITHWIIKTIEELTTGSTGLHDFAIGNLADTGSDLALSQGKPAEVEAPVAEVRSRVLHNAESKGFHRKGPAGAHQPSHCLQSDGEFVWITISSPRSDLNI